MRAAHKRLLAAALATAVAATWPAHAQDEPGATRIGVVDTAYILENAEAAKGLRETIQGRQAEFQEQITQEEQAIQEKQQELRQQQDLLNEDALQQRQQQLQQRMQRFRRQVQQMRQQLGQWRQQGRAKVQRKVGEIVQDLADERDLALVVDRTQAVYVTDRYDLTQDVLEIFDEEVDEITLEQPSQSGAGAGTGAGTGTGTGTGAGGTAGTGTGTGTGGGAGTGTGSLGGDSGGGLEMDGGGN